MLIDKILPERGVGVIYGASGVGKTFVILSLAFHVALGIELDDLKVQQRDVLILLNEGQAGFSLRSEAWLKFHDRERPQNLLVGEVTPQLMNTENLEPFIGLAEKMNFNPGLIVIDCFSKASLGGNDNSATEMAQAIDSAQALANHFQGLVLLIDHEGKRSENGVRGSSSKRGNVDMMARIKRHANCVILQTEKQKEIEDGLEFKFLPEKQSMPLQDAPDHTVPVYVPMFDPVGKLVKAQKGNQKDYIIAQLGEGPVSREVLQQSFMERYHLTEGNGFRSLLTRLVREKKIIRENEFIRLAE